MLSLPDAWVWDCWIVSDGPDYHLFFLFASRALHDPNLRHRNASVGHAVSQDLRNWTRVADAVVAGETPAFDELATWTGSVVQAPGGQWVMYYTGARFRDAALVQTIGIATSDDLLTWHKYVANPVLVADGRWYELAGESSWQDEHWRDPWVFADPGGDGWHMLITARAKDGADDNRGVVGHARSQDMLTWIAQPPLSKPGAGFGQLEVIQIECIDGQNFLVFSCLAGECSTGLRIPGQTGGMWSVAIDSVTGPYDISAATALTDDSLYAGRLVRDPAGRWVLLSFHNNGPYGFGGSITDPIPVLMSEGQLITVPTA